jgi:hypothetical protein
MSNNNLKRAVAASLANAANAAKREEAERIAAIAAVEEAERKSIYTPWQTEKINKLLSVETTQDIYNLDRLDFNALQAETSVSEEDKLPIYELLKILSRIYYSIYADTNEEKNIFLNDVIVYVNDSVFHISIKQILLKKIKSIEDSSIQEFVEAKQPSQIINKSFSQINEWVEKYNKSNKLVCYAVKETIDSAVTDYNFSINSINYTKMFSSGSNSDCMIHSLLTASSPSFRKIISQHDKDKLATYFRKNVFYQDSIKRNIDTNPMNEIERKVKNWKGKFLCFTPGIYLEAYQLGLFSDIYKFVVLINELNLTYNIISDNAEKEIGIFMANTGGGHFESFRRTKKIDNKDPYIFTRDELLEIQSSMVNPAQREISSNRCKFKNYDIIEHNRTKEKFVVINLIFPDQKPNETYVSCSSIITVPLLKNDHSIISLAEILEIKELDNIEKRKDYNKKTHIIDNLKDYTIISREIIDKNFNERKINRRQADNSNAAYANYLARSLSPNLATNANINTRLAIAESKVIACQKELETLKAKHRLTRVKKLREEVRAQRGGNRTRRTKNTKRRRTTLRR